MKQETQWLSDFRRKLGVQREVPYVPRSLNDRLVQVPKQKNLLAAIVLITTLVVILAVVAVKKWPVEQPTIENAPPPAVETPHLPPGMPTIRLEDRVSSLETEIQGIQTNIKAAFDRLAVVGSISNNNTIVMANNGAAQDLVYINGDWTMNKLPPHLSNNESLQRFVKAQ